MNDHAFIVQKLLMNFEGRVAQMTIKDSTNLKHNSSPQHIVFRADRAPLPYHFMVDLSLSKCITRMSDNIISETTDLQALKP